MRDGKPSYPPSFPRWILPGRRLAFPMAESRAVPSLRETVHLPTRGPCRPGRIIDGRGFHLCASGSMTAVVPSTRLIYSMAEVRHSPALGGNANHISLPSGPGFRPGVGRPRASSRPTSRRAEEPYPAATNETSHRGHSGVRLPHDHARRESSGSPHYPLPPATCSGRGTVRGFTWQTWALPVTLSSGGTPSRRRSRWPSHRRSVRARGGVQPFTAPRSSRTPGRTLAGESIGLVEPSNGVGLVRL